MIIFQKRSTDKQATTQAPLYRVAIQQSHQASLSFPELLPDVFRKALVGDFHQQPLFKWGSGLALRDRQHVLVTGGEGW